MDTVKIMIIGAGFGGLCMGIKLKQAHIDDFMILEKADDLGGTWRENTYPGAECDIPSALYSYSFAHNDAWHSKWSGQKQIHQYQHDTAKRYQLEQHIKYQQQVTAATFNDTSQRWLVTTQCGQQYDVQHVICAVGQLHHPSVPVFKNAEKFTGSMFHAAQWKHDVDLSDKSVAVIGSAASAVQFIPEIANEVKRLTVFQRSPNWILPKIDRPYAKWEQRLSAKVPLVTKAYRWSIWAIGEYLMFPAIKGHRLSRFLVKTMCKRNLNRHIQDQDLKTKLTPDYPIGAKRVLFSDHYYPALASPQVDLNCDGVQAFDEQGIIDNNGQHTPVDVIIYGTGFKTNPFLADIEVWGSQLCSLRDTWKNGAHAYLGVSVNGYPNLHLLYGPNTNLGHTSIIIMLEAQSDYVLSLITHLDNTSALSCEVKRNVELDYNQALQVRLKDMAFSKIANSWYKDGDKVTNNWAGGTKEYVRRLQTNDLENYRYT